MVSHNAATSSLNQSGSFIISLLAEEGRKRGTDLAWPTIPDRRGEELHTIPCHELMIMVTMSSNTVVVFPPLTISIGSHSNSHAHVHTGRHTPHIQALTHKHTLDPFTFHLVLLGQTTVVKIMFNITAFEICPYD